MRLKKLGIDWGAAYGEANPVIIRAENGTKVLVYEMEGGGLCFELPRAAKIEVGYSTRPDERGEYPRPVLCAYVDDPE